MNNRFFKSFRFKIIMIFLSSGAISGAVSGAVYYRLWLFYHSEAIYGDRYYVIRQFIKNNIGDLYAFLILFLPLFFIAFLILTKYYTKILSSISLSILRIAEGDFNISIPVKSNDEIGQIAKNVNKAAVKLKRAVEVGEFANSSKNRLIANIAHDLRTPLTSINGYLDLIIKNDNLSSREIQHHAHIAYNKAVHMEHLISELFEYSKFNFTDEKITKNNIDLSLLIRQVHEEFIPIFNKNNLEGRISIKNEPLYVNANGSMIARVLDNLLNNAVRYGSDGKFVDIEVFKENEEAVVRIINYDSMIPKEDTPKIFETFYKSDKARSSKASGTGLGLAIVKNIVDAHNGKIAVDSNIEKTCFEVRFALLNFIEY